MISRRTYFILFGLIPLFSSCVTSFETGQEAATLPRKDLAAGFDVGIWKAAVTFRYGLLNKFDLGASCDFNLMDLSPNRGFPQFSTDCKWQFLGTPEKHFVLATGLGFGTGVDRTWLYNEDYYHSEEEGWSIYGGRSLDGYLPLYFSYYLVRPQARWSFNFNPYLVYRFGFYDKFDSWAPGDDYTGYRSLNQVFGGTAFSIGMGTSHNSLRGVMNLLYAGPGSHNSLDEFELYLSYIHKFQLGKKK